ncbi:hypothetical protein QYE76_064009 [Lolium multiflorum]|uniref:Dymeclin n=1 Tax=Lolium multiflorum TaxID=4521 RepID=A0AAD8W9M5_LOLMU|nr:hypothetical protein QYE76_064009 [Lolium multiflorum]
MSRVWPKGCVQPRRRHDACVPPAGVERHQKAETPIDYSRMEHPLRAEDLRQGPTPEPSNRQEEATTTTATAHLPSERRPHPWPPSASPWGIPEQTETTSSATDGKTEGIHPATTPPGWKARHHCGRHFETTAPASANNNPLQADSKDVYLHTNCLTILTNMGLHARRPSVYASQRLVSLLDMLSHNVSLSFKLLWLPTMMSINRWRYEYEETDKLFGMCAFSPWA